jgi:leucyl-tRNA synthetase
MAERVAATAPGAIRHDELNDVQKGLRRKVHETLSKVTDDIGRRHTFNTAIAAVMELMNELGRFEDDSAPGRSVLREAMELVIMMLSPIAPHITQHLWNALGREGILAESTWPVFDAQALQRDSIEMVVQVNGKLRSKIQVPADADNDAIESIALNDDRIQLNIEGKAVRKVIVVPGRLVNLVVA